VERSAVEDDEEETRSGAVNPIYWWFALATALLVLVFIALTAASAHREAQKDQALLDYLQAVIERWSDQREPGEAFCAACPDHEACASGYPCGLVRRINPPPQLLPDTEPDKK
jgi:hypothetical protein